ncbi:MAG: Ger(x)C family spore germination protein, partial [Bacillota bacterium]|nr:Ger(x)C family spore germination protein [Bacillota bacterium]
MKLHKLLCLILTLMFILTSCGFKDIDKRFFVVGIGIDKLDKSTSFYDITLKLAIPNTEPKKGGSNFISFTEQSNSIAEGVRRVKAKVDKELEFGHMQVIVFGANLASTDLTSSVDWFSRRRDIQKVAFMAIGSPDAKTVIEKRLHFESLPSSVLVSSFDGTGTETNYITTQYLFEFYRRHSELGLDPFLPVITIEKDNLKIDQLALFEKKDLLRTKLILSPEETKLYSLIANKKRRTSFEINTKNVNYVLDVHSINRNYEIIETANGNKGEIKFNFKVSGSVEESSEPNKKHDFEIYERETAEVLQKKVTALLKKIQGEGLDPIGFGLHYRSRHWNNDTEWDTWQKLYPD